MEGGELLGPVTATLAAGGLGTVLWNIGQRVIAMLEVKFARDHEIKLATLKAQSEAALEIQRARDDQSKALERSLRQVIGILGQQASQNEELIGEVRGTAEQNDRIIAELQGINSIDLPRRSSVPAARREDG